MMMRHCDTVQCMDLYTLWLSCIYSYMQVADDVTVIWSIKVTLFESCFSSMYMQVTGGGKLHTVM